MALWGTVGEIAADAGWSVQRSATGDGIAIMIEREDGHGFFGRNIPGVATEDRRNEAKAELLKAAATDTERARVEAAFLAPWVNA